MARAAVAAGRTAVPAERERRFWSFRPLSLVATPPMRDQDWIRTPVDRFILAALERHGLKPNPLADRRT